ncbi:MAG: PDZ domain-containing protein [Oscillospiraceae bacterium]|nr:PDZ domain-containing protein [Oscillospiraceae bacterium]
MNKKVTVGITLAFIFITIALTFTATMLFSMNLFDKKIVAIQDREKMYEKIAEIDSFVRQNYYLGVDDEKIMEGLAKGYISGTGDASVRYFNSFDVARITKSRTGKMTGIGVEAEINANGYVQIKDVYSSTSAEKIGMKPGDTIIKVNDQDALELGAETVMTYLYGDANDQVSLTFSREGTDSTFDFVYADYETYALHTYDVDGYLYFRILAFNDLTLGQFQDTIAEKLPQGTVKGLVFDMRDVDGGYDVTVAANILDKLLPQCTLVSGIYQGGLTKVLFTSDPNSVDLPIAVLVNGGTKGYSELFAAVLGEFNNVRIVGEQTFGDGTYSVLNQLTDGTGLYVPVCELLACGTVRFNGTGVEPDFVTAPEEGFVIAEGEPSTELDLQLRKAIEVLDSEFNNVVPEQPEEAETAAETEAAAGSEG